MNRIITREVNKLNDIDQILGMPNNLQHMEDIVESNL